MVRRLALASLVVALFSSPGVAHAATPFTHCGQTIGLQCGSVDVPLDRSGRVPGTISLYTEVLPTQETPSRGVMFLIAGGPGQGSAEAFGLEDPDQAEFMQAVLPGYTLVAFDNRGTGKSNLINCPVLQTALEGTAEHFAALARDCANEIGPTRTLYATRDHAEDIESVRTALGFGPIALYGVSYGTKLSLAYALAHPATVARLILDSVVPPNYPDSFDLNVLHEMAGTLRAFCAGGVCRGATKDFGAELARLANRIEAKPIRARIPIPGGKTKVVRMDGEDLVSLTIDADLSPGVASELPAAVHAALAGHIRPLLRLHDLDVRTSELSAEDLSFGLNAATNCDDGDFPWAPDTPPAARRAVIDAAVNALPASAFGLFGKWSARMGIAFFCEQWPSPAGKTPLGAGPLPDVPVLIVSGGFDLRTPTANATAVAAMFRHARLIIVPGVGHSVLSPFSDYSFCSQRAVRSWILGGTVPSTCPRVLPIVGVVQSFPKRGVRTAAGTLTVATRAVQEAEAAWTQVIFSGATFAPRGVYGGSLTLSNSDLSFTLKRYAIAPGVLLSGKLTTTAEDLPFVFTGTVHVSGKNAVAGTLKVSGSKISGTLGGRKVAGKA